MLHYHRHCSVSLLCSEWGQVVPERYLHQAIPFKNPISFQSIRRPRLLFLPFLTASAKLSGRCMAKTLGSLVQVRSTPRSASTPCLSTSSSLTVLTDSRSGKTHLRARFPLRCFQRLSIPNLATGLCNWHYNPLTSGSFTPVLSY